MVQHKGMIRDVKKCLPLTSRNVPNFSTHLGGWPQVAATEARKTFRCYDEPAIKATLNVTLIRKPNMKTWSNIPIYATF